MKKINVFILMTAALMLSLPVSAATIAYWDFEDGTAGQAFTPTGQPGGSGYTADLVGGYRMYGWDGYWGPGWTNVTPTGLGLAMRNADNHQDGYHFGSSLTSWSPTTWTIECAINLVEMAGWETIIGRDGATHGEAAADFYLSNNGIDDKFRIDIETVGGQRWILDSNFVPVINHWYRLAVTSDGITLKMYCDKMDGNGFVNVGSMAISAQTVANNALAANNFNWTFGRGWYNGGFVDHINGYMDDIRFSDKALSPNEFLSNASPYGPNPTPLNVDGTAGSLIGTNAQVTLNFQAGADPNANTAYPVNPAVLKHYVWVGTDPENLALSGSMDQIHDPDPTLTDPDNAYGPITLINKTIYYWQVEEGLNDGSGAANPSGDANNILGPVWSFKTIAAIPAILSGPANAVADASGNATLSVTASATTTSFQWYKEGTGALSNGGLYSGVTTDTLTVTGATLADEGRFYCIAYNGSTPSEPSASAWLWMRRLMNHYPFEVINVVEGNSVTPDIVGDFDAVLKQEGTAGLPVLADANSLVGKYLQLDNADHATDPNGQYAQIPAGIVAYQDLTISAWIHTKSAATWARIFDFGSGTTDYLFLTPDALNYDMRFSFVIDGGAAQDITGDLDSSNWIAPGAWHYVTVTLSGNTGRLYHNGELVATNSAMTNNPIDVGAVLNYIGKSQYSADPEFDGLIDELKIYNYARTSTEIGQDYVAIAGGWVCNNEEAALLHDLNDDCRVNLADFALMAQEWLECLRTPTESCTW